MILEAVVTYQNYLNATHCTLKMTIEFDFNKVSAAQPLCDREYADSPRIVAYYLGTAARLESHHLFR